MGFVSTILRGLAAAFDVFFQSAVRLRARCGAAIERNEVRMSSRLRRVGESHFELLSSVFENPQSDLWTLRSGSAPQFQVRAVATVLGRILFRTSRAALPGGDHIPDAVRSAHFCRPLTQAVLPFGTHLNFGTRFRSAHFCGPLTQAVLPFGTHLNFRTRFRFEHSCRPLTQAVLTLGRSYRIRPQGEI